jgi:hypothetical protein
LSERPLREAWHGRERAFPIHPILHLAPAGLVLGAGTVLIPTEAARRPTSLAAAFARRLFERASGGRDRIDIQVELWLGSRP